MRSRAAVAFAVALATAACDRRDPAFDAPTLCALSEAAARTGDLEPLLAEIGRELGVPRAKLRVDPRGVFVPTGQFLFEEWGVFVARPGVVLPASTDPTFTRLDVCVHRYTIRG